MATSTYKFCWHIMTLKFSRLHKQCQFIFSQVTHYSMSQKKITYHICAVLVQLLFIFLFDRFHFECCKLLYSQLMRKICNFKGYGIVNCCHNTLSSKHWYVSRFCHVHFWCHVYSFKLYANIAANIANPTRGASGELHWLQHLLHVYWGRKITWKMSQYNLRVI